MKSSILPKSFVTCLQNYRSRLYSHMLSPLELYLSWPLAALLLLSWLGYRCVLVSVFYIVFTYPSRYQSYLWTKTRRADTEMTITIQIQNRNPTSSPLMGRRRELPRQATKMNTSDMMWLPCRYLVDRIQESGSRHTNIRLWMSTEAGLLANYAMLLRPETLFDIVMNHDNNDTRAYLCI